MNGSTETGQLDFASWSFPSSGLLVLNQQCGVFLRFLLKLKGLEYKERGFACRAAGDRSTGPAEPGELLNLLPLGSVLD